MSSRPTIQSESGERYEFDILEGPEFLCCYEEKAISVNIFKESDSEPGHKREKPPVIRCSTKVAWSLQLYRMDLIPVSSNPSVSMLLKTYRISIRYCEAHGGMMHAEMAALQYVNGVRILDDQNVVSIP